MRLVLRVTPLALLTGPHATTLAHDAVAAHLTHATALNAELPPCGSDEGKLVPDATSKLPLSSMSAPPFALKGPDM